MGDFVHFLALNYSFLTGSHALYHCPLKITSTNLRVLSSQVSHGMSFNFSALPAL